MRICLIIWWLKLAVREIRFTNQTANKSVNPYPGHKWYLRAAWLALTTGSTTGSREVDMNLVLIGGASITLGKVSTSTVSTTVYFTAAASTAATTQFYDTLVVGTVDSITFNATLLGTDSYEFVIQVEDIIDE